MRVALEKNDKNLFLKRLIISDASFLTLREKLLLESYCSDSADVNLEKLSLSDISVIIGRALSRCSWNPEKSSDKAKNAMRLISLLSIGCVHYEDDDYPAMLREMRDPPYMIFYRGNLCALNKKCVSVVGTRRATGDGLRSAREFSKAAAEDDWCVVSGLAFGIDSAAHSGALSAQNGLGATCAVLPGGIDEIAPRSNTPLARKIISCGGVILSEYVPGTPCAAFRFVQRNRIVAALSPFVIVVQAPCGSGAMITAELALDYNREVFFHKSSLSPESDKLSEVSARILKNLVAQGRKVEYKLNNCPEKFIEDGAAVIGNFADFKTVISQGAVAKKETELPLLFSEKING